MFVQRKSNIERVPRRARIESEPAFLKQALREQFIELDGRESHELRN
ncbi:hypothetical protein FRUB_06431 [Fimbriiglobus ruber]|uniref:Uncharacterized protein n=1 Tax=Fimbriiglobus ruber TaxID=1908690 RepID=A0A225D6W0_9BACT|nr:hypothetical protein FRUB_06431 [Fimbriiglobus ruber]